MVRGYTWNCNASLIVYFLACSFFCFFLLESHSMATTPEESSATGEGDGDSIQPDKLRRNLFPKCISPTKINGEFAVLCYSIS